MRRLLSLPPFMRSSRRRCGDLLAATGTRPTQSSSYLVRGGSTKRDDYFFLSFFALFLAVSRVVSTVEVFTAEAERILLLRLSRGEASSPPARVLVPEGAELALSPLDALRSCWVLLRSTVDEALLPALRASARAATRAGNADGARDVHAAIVACLANAPSASLVGVTSEADLGESFAASRSNLVNFSRALRGALVRSESAAEPGRVAAAAGYSTLLVSSLTVMAEKESQSAYDGVGSMRRRGRVYRDWHAHRPVLLAWLEALRGADSEPSLRVRKQVHLCSGSRTNSAPLPL